MKKKAAILVMVALTLLGMALPLNLALAKGAHRDGTVTQSVQARAAAKKGRGIKATKPTKQRSKPQVTVTQLTDPCANDTADDQEVNDGADTDTDNVDLQCGDQSGPDEQVQDAADSDTGTTDTDNVQDETPGPEDNANPLSVPSNQAN